MGYKGATVDMIWVDEFADPWGPTGRYGKVIEDAMRDLAMYGNAFVKSGASCAGIRVSGAHPIKFDTEGEKQMEKIDWHKPLRVYPPGERNEHQKVYTFKSGKQRVVWIDDHVYPVDDDGRATAGVWYRDTPEVVLGEQIVENVPEEEFFLGLGRNQDGTYWLTDGGTVSNMGTMNYWKKLMGDQPHWIVDTRKPAEPPAVNVHDPKDWTVVRVYSADCTRSFGMMTESQARVLADRKADDAKMVRVRTTPPPADTARYIQLWRMKESDPWLINKMGSGRQEFTWAETQHRGASPTRCAIKVRD